MAFTRLPPGTRLVYDDSLRPHRSHTEFFIRPDGCAIEVSNQSAAWPLRNMAYIPDKGVSSSFKGYPVAADAEGRIGYDPDWWLLAAIDRDIEKVRVQGFAFGLQTADPMTAHPDPLGPGNGLPLPFALLQHSARHCSKVWALLRKFPREVLVHARWEGKNLLEFLVSANLGGEPRADIQTDTRGNSGSLALATWLAAALNLEINDPGVCRRIVEKGFFYRRAFNLRAIKAEGFRTEMATILGLDDIAVSGISGFARARLLASAPGLLRLPPDAAVEVVLQRRTETTGRPGHADPLVTLSMTPATAAALVDMAMPCQMLSSLAHHADGRIAWVGSTGPVDAWPPFGPTFAQGAEWFHQHGSPPTRARLTASLAAGRFTAVPDMRPPPRPRPRA